MQQAHVRNSCRLRFSPARLHRPNLYEGGVMGHLLLMAALIEILGNFLDFPNVCGEEPTLL